MPSATLSFSAPINVSCQVGDIVYYVTTASSGGFDINNGGVVEIGEIREIQNPNTPAPSIIANTTLGYTELNGLTDKFILFSKNNKANLSSPVGYFASVKMTNNDSVGAGELYSVAVDAFTSSGQGGS